MDPVFPRNDVHCLTQLIRKVTPVGTTARTDLLQRSLRLRADRVMPAGALYQGGDYALVSEDFDESCPPLAILGIIENPNDPAHFSCTLSRGVYTEGWLDDQEDRITEEDMSWTDSVMNKMWGHEPWVKFYAQGLRLVEGGKIQVKLNGSFSEPMTKAEARALFEPLAVYQADGLETHCGPELGAMYRVEQFNPVDYYWWKNVVPQDAECVE